MSDLLKKRTPPKNQLREDMVDSFLIRNGAGTVGKVMQDPYRRSPAMPAGAAHHHQQEKVLINNLFVHITRKYPQMSRSKRKAMATTIAKARIQQLIAERKASKDELAGLEQQDMSEINPEELMTESGVICVALEVEKLRPAMKAMGKNVRVLDSNGKTVQELQDGTLLVLLMRGSGQRPERLDGGKIPRAADGLVGDKDGWSYLSVEFSPGDTIDAQAINGALTTAVALISEDSPLQAE